VIDAEAIRSEALVSLGSAGDARARDVLMHARAEFVPDVARWSGSTGHVRGHRVRLVVSARNLGVLHAAPAVLDAVTAAVAHAIGAMSEGVLVGLETAWGLASREAGYRDALVRDVDRTDAPTVHAAFVEYLDAIGESLVARAVAEGSIEIAPRVVVRSDDAALRGAHARAVLERAARALLASDVRIDVVGR
jgi:hypothetical protein